MSPILLFQLPEFHLPKLVKPSVFDATVIIAGISIVIGVLLLLILIFNIFGKMVPKIEVASKKHEEKRAVRKAARKAKKEAKKAAKMLEKNPESAVSETVDTPKVTPVVKTAPVPAPVVEQGISGEVVAAITAAIVATEGSDVVVRSIRKKNVSGRNPWAQAANIDNTRPF